MADPQTSLGFPLPQDNTTKVSELALKMRDLSTKADAILHANVVDGTDTAVAAAVNLTTSSTRTALTAWLTQVAPKTANATLGSGVALYTAGQNVIATRQGVHTNVNGRLNRTSANNNVVTIPSGYRPSREIYVPGTLAGAFVLVQIATTGVVTTPFSTATGDLMLNVSFVSALTPLPA